MLNVLGAVGNLFFIAPNVLQIGDRFVKRWHCAVGQTAANVLLGDRYFLCVGIYKY